MSTIKNESKDKTDCGSNFEEDLSKESAQAKTWNQKFDVLIKLIKQGSENGPILSDIDIVDTIFHLMVGGEFDLETNFVITQNFEGADQNKISKMLDVMENCNVKCQAEIWSTFKGICRKSFTNLQACVDVHLVQKLLTMLNKSDDIISELAVDMLSIVTSYNIRVKELKQLLSMLKSENGKWPRNAVKLLSVLESTPERQGPDCFFNFSGVPSAAIALPPLKTWPYNNGFTVTTWFRCDPLNNLRVDVDKPYLYCFRNSKGLGYSAHFVGGCLIITILKSKTKGFQHCVKFDFKPKQWYMITIVHVYNRWRTSELKCYANGQLASTCEMNWYIGGNDQFDKCFLGSAESGDASRVFCGQIAAFYVFSEELSASQIHAIHQLGPGYKNQFRFATESDHLLANRHRKVLYEDCKLSDSLVFAYNAKSSDGKLCLECSPRSSRSDVIGSITSLSTTERWFVHSPHALMLPGVDAVVTHSIYSALHSVGGIEILFPLFNQLDHKQIDGSLDNSVCSTLLNFLYQLLQGSVKAQQQILNGKGFLVIGSILEKSDKSHITDKCLESLIRIGKLLEQSTSNGVILMRQFCDYILFNPNLWVNTCPSVQNKLYTYLATDLVQSPAIQSSIRRVSTVLLFVHALKYYYWVVDPQPRSGISPKSSIDARKRPTKDELMSLRAFILLFIKQIITKSLSVSEDEIKAICGYLLTVHEDENILDVIQLLVAMISEHGEQISPGFESQQGIAVIFKLMASDNLLVRIQSLKLLAYFFKNLSSKRKTELMDEQGLFSLITERLLLHGKMDVLNMSTYNALYEVMVEKPCTQVVHKQHSDPGMHTVIHNPAIMKVIANLIRHFNNKKPSDDEEEDVVAVDDPTIIKIKTVFLNDLIKLFESSKENRRVLLQQSVWQDWLLDMGYLRPNTKEQDKIQQLVYKLLEMLLFHAVKVEWGGWRVWVDTLAIVHSKISLEEHREYVKNAKLKYTEDKNKSLSLSNGGENNGLQNENKSDNVEQLAHEIKDINSNGEVLDSDKIKTEEVEKSLDSDPQNENKNHVVDQLENGIKEINLSEENLDNQSIKMEGIENGLEGNITPSLVIEKDSSNDQQIAVDSNLETDNNLHTNGESLNLDNNDKVVETNEMNEHENTSSEKEESSVVQNISNSDKVEEEKIPDENIEEDHKSDQASTVNKENVSEDKPSETPGEIKESKNIGENKIKSPEPQQFSPGPRTLPFRIPEFKWNQVHLKILDDLFKCIEEDVEKWKSNTEECMSEIVGSNDNIVYVHNTLHLISQMMDNIVLACGGILPILSSATSPTYELDSIESSQGLSLVDAWQIMNRLVKLMEVMTFSSNVSLSEIENEKNISSGGVLRQALRSVCLCAVRNCLENRYVCKQTEPLNTTSSYMAYNQPDTSGSYHTKAHHQMSKQVKSSWKDAEDLVQLMSKDATPVLDASLLLQELDVHRLRNIIYYRDIEDAKQAQFLGVAVVYFVSVLMVSKYRDILDPFDADNLGSKDSKVSKEPLKNSDENLSSIKATNIREEEVVVENQVEAVPEKFNISNVKDILKNLTKSPTNQSQKNAETSKVANTKDNVSFKSNVKSIESNFHSFDRSVIVAPKNTNNMSTDDTILKPQKDSQLPKQIITNSINNIYQDVSLELERSMNHLSSLIRDIFVDFSSYLSKTLVGSQGQDLLVEGLTCMKSHNSIVEIVMLLCSQEWQNSIQKNAGLAFIELINEGRILCHAMKEHLVRVANEAEFILSKQKAEDVKLHAQFQSSNAVHTSQQREEDRQCDQLIMAAKHRDHMQARLLVNRITNILTNKQGAWGSDFNNDAKEYWKLDSWEDDTRRRRRFVRNLYGSSHKEAVLNQDCVVSSAKNTVADASLTSRKKVRQHNKVDDDVISSDSETTSDHENIEDLQTGNVSLTTEADLICPGLCLKGNFSITTDEIFFEVDEKHESFQKADVGVLQYAEGIHGKWLFQEIRAIFSRKYLLQSTALEIFFANRTSVMFNFSDPDVMKKIVACLPRVGIGTGYGLPQDRRTSLATPRQLFKQSNMTTRWQKREISNFEYLMFLNSISGRTMNDLNQYPVFPWVISNYESDELDLTIASNFRNFAQPVGALNAKRAEYFKQRYEGWEDEDIPKFHYGTHYSNAAFTLSWLVRVEPFTSLFLSFQGGKFDHADRTFHSILQSWKNCQRDSHDVKELIPEFFYLPEMFVNCNNYDFGKTSSDDAKVDDVILPKWAKTADDFVRINRQALESEIVSCQLHQWIDLIFGFKQRGPAAVESLNVFYYLTYENSVNLNDIQDPVERAGVRDQIKNFGQTPSQLLYDPHPPKSSAMHLTPMMFSYGSVKDLLMVLKFKSNSPIMHVVANTHPSLKIPAVVTCTKNLQFAINTWLHESDGSVKGSSAGMASGEGGGKKLLRPVIEIDPTLEERTHKRQIREMLDQSVEITSSCFSVTADNRYLVTCGYWDRSFRVTALQSGKLEQTIFGHHDVVTCLTRSETYIAGDCYFVSGSMDTTLMLWYWSGRRSKIIGSDSNYDNPGQYEENPSARAVLTGHNTQVVCCAVCAELGLISSASHNGPVLIHTITGDLLRSLTPDSSISGGYYLQPRLMLFTGEGMVIVTYESSIVCSFTMNGRQIASKVLPSKDKIQTIYSSNNSDYLVTGSKKGFVEIWNLSDFKHLYTYQQCDAGINSITLSHDQKNIICGMSTGSIVVFRSHFDTNQDSLKN